MTLNGESATYELQSIDVRRFEPVCMTYNLQSNHFFVSIVQSVLFCDMM
jgi:hypothetical protein